jgi:hypothetical protein
MRVWKHSKVDSGTAWQPFTMSTSTSIGGSSAFSGVVSASPMHNAAWDQVDWVRYLMAVETRVLPSTSSTSPGRMVARNAAGVPVVGGA